MGNESAEEIIKIRTERRLTKSQGIDFLREYRKHPEKFLPLIDHQYKLFDEWEDQESRNLCWDAGIFQDNCPYFAECWKIFTTTVMTVFISKTGIDWEPNLKNILVEFIRNGLIAGLAGSELPYIETKVFTDKTGTEFYSFNLVLGDEAKGRFIDWGRGHAGYDELNQYNKDFLTGG